MNKPEEEEEVWNDSEEQANPSEVLATCMQNFAKQDYILEPSIFYQLKR
jgi:hypothetical protein